MRNDRLLLIAVLVAVLMSLLSCGGGGVTSAPTTPPGTTQPGTPSTTPTILSISPNNTTGGATPDCGAAWVAALDKLSSLPATQKVDDVQIVSWNDYENGSQIEAGVDNCVSITPTLTDDILTWQVSGNTATIDHYAIFMSPDGETLTSVANVPAKTSSFDLATASLPADADSILFVQAVGKPSVLNKVSLPVVYPKKTRPTVSLSVQPLSGPAPLATTASITASIASGRTITAQSIDFGDGAVVNGANASHTYAAAGQYTVTATVTDSGRLTSTSATTVTVSAPAPNQPPVAKLAVTPTSGNAPLTVSASTAGSSDPDGSIASTSIDFGDGTVVNAASGSHTYNVAGNYTVKATVTDNGGLGTTETAAVAVSSTSVPSSNIQVTITEPTYHFNVIPGSVRRIYATVTNGTTNGVNWTVSDGGSLARTSGPWVDVTAPSSGASCQINDLGNGSYSVTSAKTFTVTATSQEDASKSATITVNVCNPAVEVNVVPFYTTLYAGQKADVQAFVWGSVNRNVKWAITSQPNGGNGSLVDSNSMDTVFSATVAGRYTLTATSVADGTKSNTATVYVTGHAMPYHVTPAKTMPVDCSVDPEMTGKVYEVGPSKAYKRVQDVPWSALTAGSTVRIHNEDTTGTNATTYHEYFQIPVQAKRAQPIRVCGVPDASGNLPVLDGANATGRSDTSAYAAGYAVAFLGATGWAGVYTGAAYGGPQYLIVEGLKIQNAKSSYTYTTPSGTAGKAWVGGAACVRAQRAVDYVVRGMELYGCGNGTFSDFNAGNGYGINANALWEGNHIHGNGQDGSYLEHQLYVQGLNQVMQFNVIDEYNTKASGSNLKSRGFPDVIRYNHFGDGTSRQLDLIDNEDAGPYTTFNGYLNGGAKSYKAIYPKDTYPADKLAAAMEAHHADYVYGNTFVNSTAGVPIHYTNDHGSVEGSRLGTLWFYNNSFYEPACNNCGNWRWSLFDTSSGGGNDAALIEWPQFQVFNNAIWMDNSTKPYFSWNNRTTAFLTFGKNAINANWGTNNMAGGDGTGWASWASQYAFQGASNAADVAGVTNLFTVSSAPFDKTTFAAGAVLAGKGQSLPADAAGLPVRFQFGPSATPALRSQPLTVGATE